MMFLLLSKAAALRLLGIDTAFMIHGEEIVLKRLFRQKIRKRLEHLTRHDACKKSWAICERILRTSEFQRSSNLMIYMALPGEVDLTALIQKAFSQGKSVYLPKVNVQSKEIEVFRMDNLKGDLRRGAFGILEPYKMYNRLKDLKALECVFVPGVVFDSNGGRIGRGIGFYDRFLSRIEAVKWGVAFREQMVSCVPRTSQDIRMDKVIHD